MSISALRELETVVGSIARVVNKPHCEDYMHCLGELVIEAFAKLKAELAEQEADEQGDTWDRDTRDP